MRKNLKKILKVFYVFGCAIILLKKECNAYIDPSAMTYVIQIGAAIAITVSTSIGIFFYKLRKKFSKKKKNDEEEL